MPVIVCLHRLPDPLPEKIRRIAPDWTLVHGNNESDWQPHLQEAEILIGWNRKAEQWLSGNGSPLRWVQNWGAGVDRIPLDLLERKGIILTNASGVHAYPISETIIGMMLSFTRKLHTAGRFQQRSEWGSIPELGEIHHKTIGIIGVGAIGEETARLAKAFGMRVLGVRRSGEPTVHVDDMYDLSELNGVLSQSDHVVVTLPLTPATRGLFGREQFAAMKPDAFFVNIGRGGTVDTEAMIEALRCGEIAGAGLDVFEEEPLPKDSALWEMENVIITPHNSGSTVYYDERAGDIFLRNLNDYLEGRSPSVNLVDLHNGY